MKKILFADDDPAIQDVISLIFEGEFEVIKCSAPETLLNNEYARPDLFLIDKQLGTVDGLEICRFLKSQRDTHEIPVIIISASPNVSSEATAAGADGVIAKPFNLADVRTLLRRHLS